jgi:hypothetical protein
MEYVAPELEGCGLVEQLEAGELALRELLDYGQAEFLELKAQEGGLEGRQLGVGGF